MSAFQEFFVKWKRENEEITAEQPWSFRWSSFKLCTACAKKKRKESRLSGRATLDFFVTILAGNLGSDLHHSIILRISCLLGLPVTICHCGQCFSLIHSTLLQGDRAIKKKKINYRAQRLTRRGKSCEKVFRHARGDPAGLVRAVPALLIVHPLLQL